MARPTPFDRQTSFTQFSSNFPSKPQNGASLDAEFNAVKVALDETQSNLARIQDDDGVLARGSVGRAQFDASVTLGFGAPSSWQPDTVYDADSSTVFFEARFYIATETHTSGDTFDASKWEEIADLSASNSIDDGSITDAKIAPRAVTAEKIDDLAVTEPKLASAAVSTPKIQDNAVTFSKLANDVGPGLANLVIPAGVMQMWPFAGDAPAGWVFDGGTYNRADYPALATRAVADAANPTSWFTVGDGVNTFGIKSAKGRNLVGIDADGSVIGAIVGLGATTGTATKSIGQTNLPAIKPALAVTDPKHKHSVPKTMIGTLDGAAGGSTIPVYTPGASDTDSVETGVTVAFANNLGNGTPLSVVQPGIGVRFIFKAH